MRLVEKTNEESTHARQSFEHAPGRLMSLFWARTRGVNISSVKRREDEDTLVVVGLGIEGRAEGEVEGASCLFEILHARVRPKPE